MRALLSIGIDNYPGGLVLKGCAAQAKEFAKLMAKNEGGGENFFTKVEDKIASVADLNNILWNFFEKKGETAVLYFTGHGINNQRGSYLVTPDYKKGNEGVSMDSILHVLNHSGYSNKIVILDCCHSGQLGSPINSGGVSAYITEGTSILAASTGETSAYLVNGKGIFTNLLIDALQGDAADMAGNITPGSVYAYIDRFLGPFDLQRPVFKANVSSFTILRKVVPKMDPEKLLEYFKSADADFPLNPSFEFTNIPETPPYVKEPYANDKNVVSFKMLQKFVGAGFVEPVGEEHMFYAAMNSKSCRLTPLGKQYWRLMNNKNKHI